MVRSSRFTALVVLLAIPLMLGLVGCDNKVKADRDSLLKQNQELQAQLAQEKADQAAKEAEMERLRAAAMAAQAAPAPATQPGTPDMAAAPVDPTGGIDLPAGTITRSKTKAGETQLEVTSDVLFDSGSSVLKPSAKRVLEKVIAILKSEYAHRTFRIEGHTDSRPFKKSSHMTNEKLGLARAESVKKFLTHRGISASKLSTVSFGASQPKSKSNLALNRRVAIVVEN